MKKSVYIVLAVSLALLLSGCDKGEKKKEYTSPCADLEVKGSVTDMNGRPLGSMTVTIAHVSSGSTTYTSSSDDVVQTSTTGAFSKKYTEFYPPFTDLQITVTDAGGVYRTKTVYVRNVTYSGAYGLYAGSASADVGTVKLLKQ